MPLPGAAGRVAACARYKHLGRWVRSRLFVGAFTLAHKFAPVHPGVKLLRRKILGFAVQAQGTAHPAQPRTRLLRRHNIVGRHQNRYTLTRQLPVQLSERGLGGCIHPREGLIKKQKRWFNRESTRQKHPLPLTAGKLADGTVLQRH